MNTDDTLIKAYHKTRKKWNAIKIDKEATIQEKQKAYNNYQNILNLLAAEYLREINNGDDSKGSKQ